MAAIALVSMHQIPIKNIIPFSFAAFQFYSGYKELKCWTFLWCSSCISTIPFYGCKVYAQPKPASGSFLMCTKI